MDLIPFANCRLFGPQVAQLERSLTQCHLGTKVLASFYRQVHLCLQQGVKEHDALIVPKAIQVGVGVRAPSGAIHLEELGQWILQLACQVLDALPQVLVFECLELVEKRHDDGGINKHEDENQYLSYSPHVEVELVASPFDDVNDYWNQDDGEHDRQSSALQEVRDKQLQSFLVEAMPLLQHKVLVQVHGNADWKSYHAHQELPSN
mmetsp:Transcript_31256/g.57185  ORF Transcript_31256/g.57185 Transcript_31256/m.57185 type:complete len:206 (-) Transcript_31256:382-999(-)